MLKTVKAILIEINLTERYKNAPLYTDITSFLLSHGFTLDTEALHHETWGDALFIKAV
jgi:hypothetical protein